MYLKKLKLINYRKFREQDNEVEFVDASSYSDVESGVNIATTATLIVGKNNAGKTTIVQALDKIINRNNIIKYEFENIATNETNFTRSDKLTIIVSKGEKVLNMEDFTSKTQTEAEKWCQENNVIYEVKEKFSDTIENGKIISQSVENGQELTDDTTIVFEVSIGAGIKIPNYSKVSSDETQELSDKVKLKIKKLRRKRSC